MGDQWDALPSSAKVQILGAVGFLEMCGEASVFLEADGQQHYVRGGKPGYYPTLKDKFPHPIPFNLFDPFGLTAKMTPERKEKALLAEINNGRLAMIGIWASSPLPRASSSLAWTRSASPRTRASRWRRSLLAIRHCHMSRTCLSSPSRRLLYNIVRCWYLARC